MKSVLVLLQEALFSASPAEEGIIRYILNSPDTAANLTIKRLSEQTYASQATIVRLCVKIGFSGYREFRRSLSGEVEVIKHAVSKNMSAISKTDTLEELTSKVTMMNIRSLEDTLRLIDIEALSACISLIEHRAVWCWRGTGGCSLCLYENASN